MRSRRLLIHLVFLGLAFSARATVGPPVRVRVVELLEAPAVGKLSTIGLEIDLMPGVIADGLNFRGDGWSILDDDLPAAIFGEQKRATRVTLRAMPTRRDAPLRMEFSIDGDLHALDVQLRGLPDHAPALPGKLRALSAHELDSTPVPAGDWLLPEPHPLDELDDPESDGEASASSKAPRPVRLHGRFTYLRENPNLTTTTVGVDGLAFRVYDDDFIGRQLLGSSNTDVDGYFDITVNWNQNEADPDLYIEFETANGVVDVQEPVLGYNYVWATGITQNYTGTDIDYGSLTPLVEAEHPALHVYNTVLRTWRWLYLNEGYNTPHTNVQWPADWTGSFYGPFGDIHIVPEDQWKENVIVHEYGHHWENMFSTLPATIYCNGFCDISVPLDCGHCLWCQEGGAVAWKEGFADWMGEFLPQTFLADYGLLANYWWSFETLNQCFVDSNYHPANLTEGFFAAVLRDIMDTANDDDFYSPGIADELAMGTNEIFEVADLDGPTTPFEFLNAFKARHTGVTPQLWATAKNNGYDLDSTPPPAPTNVYSTTHPLNTPEGNPQPQFLWDIPLDDVSGVAGFSVSYSSAVPGLPDQTMDIGVQNYFNAPPLAPGSYYFNIRTVDRDGNWSLDYGSYGPYIVDIPEPADLTYLFAGGWDGPLVPKSTNAATPGNTHVDATLPGNGNTYWNVAYTNVGDLATSTGFHLGLMLDGQVLSIDGNLQPSLPSGTSAFANNLGPVSIKGGRHTLTGFLDILFMVAEEDETNNQRGAQWSWTPTSLAGKTLPLISTAPPDKTGGWSTVPAGPTLYDNCDGYRIPAVSEWHAVVAYATDSADDYDVRLHNYNAGTTGFDTPLHESARGAGLIDAVLVNKNQAPAGDEDISVVNGNGGSGDYEIDWIESSAVTLGASSNVSFNKGSMLELRHFIIAPGQVGGLTITSRAQTGGTDYELRYYHYDFESGTLDDTVFQATADAKGFTQLEPVANQPGSYAVAVFLDPTMPNPVESVRLSVQPRLPDLTHATPTGWSGPLVPLPNPGANQFNVPTPTSLTGNAASTYLNFAMFNDSSTGAGAFHLDLRIDGRDYWPGNVGGLGGMSTSWNNNWGPYAVPGGRHVLSIQIDDADSVEESDEDNNHTGAQWVWSPMELLEGQTTTRTIPRNITDGWDELMGGAPAFYNCDGLFMDDLGQTCQAIAVMPLGGTNVDLRLHEASTSPTDGFDATLVASGWGPGLSDFVLVNTAHTTPRGFDVGVVNPGTDVGSYVAHAVGSRGLGTDPAGDFGPYQMGVNEILYLFDMQMSVGRWGFEVIQVSGEDLDWGVSMHVNDTAFLAKSTTLPGGIAWGEGVGDSEFISFDILEPGTYCLAVWRADEANLGFTGTFLLRGYDLNTVDAPGATPSRFALRGNVPNPFNPRTEIRFELSRHERVRLDVFDATGRRVRTLVAGEMLPAGRHARVWNGRDDAGRAVASGIYFARLQSRSASATRKLTLLK